MNLNHWNIFLILIGLLSLNETKSVKENLQQHSVMKRQQDSNKKTVPTLTPTLTVDVGPQSSSMPPSLNDLQLETAEYYFPVNATLFNFTCLIKNPSFRFKMKMTREQELNNGGKNGPINLIDSEDITQLNPAIQESRLQLVSDGSDEPPKYVKSSFLAYGVQIRDSGIYKCSYSNLNKQIKVTVFKQAHQNNVILQGVKTFELNKPIEITCTVKDVYPKPEVTFYSPTKQKFDNDLVVVDDISDKSEPIYAYSLVNKLTYTPKYTDHNKNLTCSVFSYSSTNVTIDSKMNVNIIGTELITNECKESYLADVDEQDVQIVCVFFSNPRLNVEWTTNQLRVSPIVVGSTATIDGINSESESSTTESPVTTMVTQWEETVTIPTVDGIITNYVSSVEDYGEPGSGLYKAVVTVKTVRNEDFNKPFKLRLFGNNNQTVAEQTIKLKKKSEYQQEQNQLTMNPSSIVNNSANDRFLHSNHLIILILQSALFVLLFNR